MLVWFEKPYSALFLGLPLLPSALSDICPIATKTWAKNVQPYNLYIGLGPFDSWLVNVVECAGCGIVEKLGLCRRATPCKVGWNQIHLIPPDRICRKKQDRITSDEGIRVVSHPCFNPIFVQFIGFVRRESFAFCRGNKSRGWLEFSLIIRRPERSIHLDIIQGVRRLLACMRNGASANH